MTQTELVAHVQALHTQLAGLPSLAPCPSTNQAFGALVKLAISPMGDTQAANVLNALESSVPLQSLQSLCGAGEFALELFWARAAAVSRAPLTVLEAFPYWQNYRKLVALEVKLLQPVLTPGAKVLFVGSGPLPISSYLLAEQLGVHVTNVDLDAGAHTCASAWLANTPMAERLHCAHRDVRAMHDFSDFQVVILAAMVGMTPADRASVLQHLAAHMRPGQILLARSARGLRQLLYRPLSGEDLQGFSIIKTVHPMNEVVNSVLLAYRSQQTVVMHDTKKGPDSQAAGCPCCGA